MGVLDLIKNTTLTPQAAPKVATKIIDGKPVMVATTTGKVLGDANLNIMPNTQMAVLDNDGKPVIVSNTDLQKALEGATVLPEVEITATPLTAFGLNVKPIYIVLAFVVLVGGYFVWKKYGKR